MTDDKVEDSKDLNRCKKISLQMMVLPKTKNRLEVIRAEMGFSSRSNDEFFKEMLNRSHDDFPAAAKKNALLKKKIAYLEDRILEMNEKKSEI